MSGRQRRTRSPMGQERKFRKTFVVSTLIGHFAGTPWPLGRVHVSDEAITVRTLFRKKTCPKSEITDISLERLGPQYQLLFEDSSGQMADVAVAMAMRVNGVVGELRRRGYPVVDRRGPLLSWREPDSPETSELPPA
jgi:hypothetical protein